MAHDGFPKRHPERDADPRRDELFGEVERVLAQLAEEAETRGHSSATIQRHLREVLRYCSGLLAEVPPEGEHAAMVPVYSREQLEQIERTYPRLRPGDIVSFSAQLNDPYHPDSSVAYDGGAVVSVTKCFPNGCSQYAEFYPIDSLSHRMLTDPAGNLDIMELNTSHMRVLGHTDELP